MEQAGQAGSNPPKTGCAALPAMFSAHMITRDDFVKSVTVAVIAGCMFFSLCFMTHHGMKEESVFALVGALIGAAATVGGAAWIADYTHRGERRTEITLLTAEYNALLAAALAAQAVEPPAGGAWPAEYRPRLDTLAEAAGSMHAVAGEVLNHAKAISFQHRVAMRRVKFAIDEFLAFWTVNHNGEDLNPADERNFPVLTQQLIAECRSAIAGVVRT